ncbi:MAG: hypothetical protein ACJAS1_003446 [Oleiphilaceae bacterium]|jgi:hypothetical protein
MKKLKDSEKELKNVVLKYLSCSDEDFLKVLENFNAIEAREKKKKITTIKEISELALEENVHALAQKAGSSYRLMTVYLSKDYEDEKLSKELQFDKSDKRMGRPTLSIEELAERAAEYYKYYLAFMRALAKEHKVEPISEISIQKKAIRTTKGRKRQDEVLAVMKYIRAAERKLDKAEAMDEEVKMPAGKGRKPKSKVATIEHCKNILNEAKAELTKKLADKSEYQLLFYKLYEVRNKKREAKKLGDITLVNKIEINISEIEAEMKSLNSNSHSHTLKSRERIIAAKTGYAKEEKEKLDKQRLLSQSKFISAKSKATNIDNEDIKNTG